MIKNPLKLCLKIFTLLLFITSTKASIPVHIPKYSLKKAVLNSSVIFIGKIDSVVWTWTKNKDNSLAHANTIVTYSLDSVLKGKINQQKIEIKFTDTKVIELFSDQNKSKKLKWENSLQRVQRKIEGQNNFVVGQKEMVFLDHKLDDYCPLYLCQRGRFILEDQAKSYLDEYIENLSRTKNDVFLNFTVNKFHQRVSSKEFISTVHSVIKRFFPQHDKTLLDELVPPKVNKIIIGKTNTQDIFLNAAKSLDSLKSLKSKEEKDLQALLK